MFLTSCQTQERKTDLIPYLMLSLCSFILKRKTGALPTFSDASWPSLRQLDAAEERSREEERGAPSADQRGEQRGEEAPAAPGEQESDRLDPRRRT